MIEDDGQLSLSEWYAEPLDEHQAQAMLSEAHNRQRQAHRQRRQCGACPFHELVAGFWLGRSTEALYDRLVRTDQDPRRRALAELIGGQLLMSRRLQGAMEHLRNGFFLAAPYLRAAEYFQVLKRHDLLALLPLLQRPAPPQGLESLLREAQVIRQLQGPRRGLPAG